MSDPIDQLPASERGEVVPLFVRVATGLCSVVGLLSLLGALVVSIPLVWSAPRTWIPLAVNTTAALLMCAAAVLAWTRRKFTIVAVVLAWLLPTVNNLLAGASIQAPSLLMVLALITLAANWQRLR
jgi:hypothetical protein